MITFSYFRKSAAFSGLQGGPSHRRMACDVTLELFGLDSNELVTESVPGDLSLDDLLVRAARRCGISPITRNLFAFKQVTLVLLS